jgi:hypothetical protein
MSSKMEFEVLAQLGEQFERLPAEPSRRRPVRISSSAAVGAALCVGIVGTASAATVIAVRSDGDKQEAELRRAFKSPGPAPVGLAASYSALADGKVHQGPQVEGAEVTVHGSPIGGCIKVMPDGARGPGGSCFTEQDLNAMTSMWNSVGRILVVLVPDAATDISVQTSDGTRQPATATSNLVVADRSDIVRYSAGGKEITVAASGPSTD